MEEPPEGAGVRDERRGRPLVAGVSEAAAEKLELRVERRVGGVGPTAEGGVAPTLRERSRVRGAENSIGGWGSVPNVSPESSAALETGVSIGVVACLD